MSETAQSTVYTSKCTEYSSALEEPLSSLLDNVVENKQQLLRSGMNVIIKPNLLTDRTPEKAVTTHPEVVRYIIRYLKKHEVSIAIADSPASAVKVQRVWKETGFQKLSEEENVPLINLEKSGSRTVTASGMNFNIAKPILEADLVINVPKVKTHTLTVLTAAVKNYYGTLPGYQKANMHKTHPKPSKFGKYVSSLYEQMPPNLNIADGIVGMEGNGPSGGSPVRLGFMAASADAFALDLTLCRILGMAPRTVPYLINAFEAWKDIKVVGPQPEDLAPATFRLPNTIAARLIPQWLVDCLAPFIWIRPQILESCIGCKRCVKACPAEALSIDADTGKAVLEDNLCISCCCCHEVCPENAINMKQSPLINFIRKGKQL